MTGGELVKRVQLFKSTNIHGTKFSTAITRKSKDKPKTWGLSPGLTGHRERTGTPFINTWEYKGCRKYNTR